MTASWKPIEPLSDKEKAIDESMAPIYEVWKASKARMSESASKGLEEFNHLLVRRLSIETGILERLYDLDRGTTEALVTHGFLEDYVSRANTTIEPSSLIDILTDHEAAIHLVMDCVAGNRDLSKGLIHELHVVLTKHQFSTSAVDPFGKKRDIELLKGKFKKFPNNPRRSDGSIHEYCPPEHVDTEIEKMISLLGEYEAQRIDPVVRASWMHHRFTQIHPYQDGNGRVVRALTTLLLLKAELLPLVIDRDLRVEYIEALEKADEGGLSCLVEMIARLERNAIMQAISWDSKAEFSSQQSVSEAVLDALAQKFSKRKRQKLDQFRKVDDLALVFRGMAEKQLSSKFEGLRTAIMDLRNSVVAMMLGGPSEGNDYWYKYDVIRTAKNAGKFANFAEGHYFVRAKLQAGPENLIFVTSFHHVGRELSGIMEATAFAQIDSEGDIGEPVSTEREFIMCSVEPFIFTYNADAKKMTASFERWLDTALAVAFKEFGDHL